MTALTAQQLTGYAKCQACGFAFPHAASFALCPTCREGHPLERLASAVESLPTRPVNWDQLIAAAREEQRKLIEGLNAALLALDYQRLASSTTIPKTKQGRWDAGSSIEEYLDQVRQEEERARALLAKHKEPQ